MATEKQLQGKVKKLKAARAAVLKKATKATKKEIKVQKVIERKLSDLSKQMMQSERRYEKALKPVDKLDEKISLAENALRVAVREREQEDESRRPEEVDGEE